MTWIIQFIEQNGFSFLIKQFTYLRDKIKYSSREAEDDLTDFEKFGLQHILNLIQNFVVAAFTATDPSMLPQIEII